MALQPTRQRTKIGKATITSAAVGAGQAVLLIHGLSGSSRWWQRNVAALAANFRVYSIDLIGFGDSRGYAFALDEAAEYVARWIDAVGIERAHVVGHSMGGYIAADLAATHPECVNRLVLVDAAVLPFAMRYDQHARSLVREFFQLPPSFYPILVGDALRAGPITLLGAASEVIHVDLRPKLAQIRAPTLLVWGERDAIVPLSLGQQLAAQLPHSELVILKQAGHNAMWDRAQEFNRAVVPFLASVSTELRR